MRFLKIRPMPSAPAFRLCQEALLRLIYPASCALCRKILELDEQSLCTACLKNFQSKFLGPQSALSEMETHAVDEAWSLFPYDRKIQELIRQIKFQKKRWLLRLFKSSLEEVCALIPNTYDAVIPIPMDRFKFMEREFNPAGMAALWAARRLKIPSWNSLLVKPRNVPSQSWLSREERLLNPLGVFQLTNFRKFVRGKNLLLADDVLTTGATAEEAARLLKEAGAKRVDLITLARSLLS